VGSWSMGVLRRFTMIRPWRMSRARRFGAGALVAVASVACSTRTPLGPTAKQRAALACQVPARPKASVSLQPVLTDLEFHAPVSLVQAPRLAGEASGRWFLADQYGEVVSFFTASDSASSTGVSDVVRTSLRDRVVTKSDALDERGLLGLALHPKFPADPRVFVTYTTGDGGLVSRVSSFVARGGALDPDSEVVVLSVAQPYTNHNGGGIAFGPDGYLYTSFGDGGNRADPHGNGQNLQTLLGKLLRVDVDGGGSVTPSGGSPGGAGVGNYTIPPDNPFVSGGGLSEIYAYGLRNTWRFSFDRETGRLWAGDVGQNAWEEIHVIEKGGNYGWNTMEGFECFPPEVASCNREGLKLPIHVYPHGSGDAGGRSVTGGYVYRGSALSHLIGGYVYADFVTGEIWQIVSEGDAYVNRPLLNSGLNISGFAEDRAGELYVLDWAGARVLRVAAGGDGPDHFPKRLSETGCFDVASKKVAKAAVPYDVSVPFWSDGATKQRYVVLPRGRHLELEADDVSSADLTLPRGGMAIKQFELGGSPIETRFYVRHEDGEYSGYTYAWREDGTDADLVETTRTETRHGQSWIFPGLEACNQCHTAAAGRTLGLTLPQLAHDSKTNDSLRELFADDAAVALRELPESLLPMADLGDAAVAADATGERALATLEVRARAYLDVNCSGCHRPEGPGRGGMDLRFATPLAQTGLCDEAALGPLDTEAGKRLTPGSAANSVAYRRMTRRDREAMPPLGSAIVDQQGAALIEAWIQSMHSCE
jgi:glucose/arabinose dehydrogenase/mono/diheme cytochrome c family protein